MEENARIISLYLARRPNYILIKKKKHVHVKDGLIYYQINLANCSCQCSETLCNHILFFLEQKFNCDCSIFKFYHKIKFNLIDANTYEELIDLIKKSIVDECGICTMQISITDNLHECKLCKKYCHMNCINKWIRTIKNNPTQDKTCIYCNTWRYI